MGEKVDDFAVFDPDQFTAALFADWAAGDEGDDTGS